MFLSKAGHLIKAYQESVLFYPSKVCQPDFIFLSDTPIQKLVSDNDTDRPLAYTHSRTP